ncbi:YcjF family protein [Methylovirgula sp. 4M-Z18]|uniref:YcjF family protein n=1 Tax=Methylovirgula sp. 4M-Z18 TaxID=2293567 RepID=UPI000E2E7920|nr:TIGR01620 family protein [Methylovirgula sp. 4M-Z18]RFB78897.1 TIGR01620 family protein [Methylovirgula sp. 4M-Z18]
MTLRPQKPRAFRLDEAGLVINEDKASAPVVVEAQPDPYAIAADQTAPEVAIERAETRGILARTFISWSGLFWSALGGLVSLAAGLWIAQLLDQLFARWQALGWIGVALVTVLVLALAVLAGREAFGIFRQRRIAKLHLALEAAHAKDDTRSARKLVADLVTLYAARPETAAARARLLEHSGEIIDGRDLIDIAERELMRGRDAEVAREIAKAAKRASLMTTLSPRAFLDVIFVFANVLRLMRRVAEIYGGRPGLLGLLKLARSVAAHLAITGGMAAGDSLLQQLVGHGIAAKVSARLGEGVLNGLLTTRVGLSAMAVCRPMPFHIDPQPGVKDVAPFLFGNGKD